MGVVQRQGLKQTIVTYLGILLGGLGVLFVFPQDLETYGLLEWILNTALILVPFVLVGTAQLAVRFYPDFKQPDGNSGGLLGLLLTILAISCLLFVGTSFLFYEPISNFILETVSTRKDYADARFLPYILIFVVLYAFVQLLTIYTSNFHRIVVPRFLEYLIPKVAKPLLFLLFVGGFLGVTGYIFGNMATLLLVILGLVLYLHQLDQWRLKFSIQNISSSMRRSMASYAAYGTLGGTGHIIANRIDIVMVGALTDFKLAGVYTIVTYLAEVIDAPRKALQGITAPLTNAAWQRSDTEEVHSLYKKSSLNLLIVGIALFGAINISVAYLFPLMKNGEVVMQGRYVVLILGLAKLVDMATGINNQVIGYSKFFRFNFYAVICLALLNVVNNYLFIPNFGINGAAMATLASMVLYNLLKCSFVWWKFRMQPFSKETAYAILLGLILYALVHYSVTIENPFLAIALRSGLFLGLFVGAVYFLKISEDIRTFIDKHLEKYGLLTR